MNQSCILHVDDSPDDSLLVQLAWRRVDSSIPLKSLSSGEEAIAHLAGEAEFADRLRHPLPCLILLDIKMNGVSGFDVLEWIRNRPELDDVVVIMLTGSTMSEDLRKAAALGANSFVTKPANTRDMIGFARSIENYWLTFHEFSWDSNCRAQKPKAALESA